MTREEAIKIIRRYECNSEHHEACEMAIKALDQEPCEDEYIKVPKKALKYRTAGMVAYNADWLKAHFDIERSVICGAQDPCEDCINRELVLEKMADYVASGYADSAEDFEEYSKIICQAPSVTPAEKVSRSEKPNKWIPVETALPEVGSEVLVCYDFKGNRSVYIANFYGDGEFHGLDDEYLTTEGRKYRKAVAWMPLPEPYKASPTRQKGVIRDENTGTT